MFQTLILKWCISAKDFIQSKSN